MLNLFNPRRRVILAGIILLAGGVVFEEWHRAATLTAPRPATKLTDTADEAGTEFLVTNKNFEAAVDLWLNPAVYAHVANITYANFVFQSELHSPIDFTRLVAQGDDGKAHPLPPILAGNDLGTALLSIGNFGHFKATLNLTFVKAKPEDLIPTQIKPGLGGSFDF